MKTTKKAVTKAAEAHEKKAAKNGGKQQLAQKGGRQITGNIGLYYACMRMSAMGLNAMPTARNTVGVDVLVNNGAFTGKTVMVQVKAVANKYAVPLGKPDRLILGDFWVVVADVEKIRGGEDPLCFVIEADAVRKARQGDKNTYLPLSKFGNPDFVDAWEKIGDAIEPNKGGNGSGGRNGGGADPKTERKRAKKARAEAAVKKILGQSDTDASEFVRCRDALLVHFVYVAKKTFRAVYEMKAREVADISGVPGGIKRAAEKVRRNANSPLVCQNNGKPYARWEVLAAIGSGLKRRWMGE